MNHTMTDSHSPSSDSSDESSSVATADQNEGRSRRSTDGSQTSVPELRHWRDVFWLGIFIIHMVGVGFALGVLGLNRFKISDRFKIDQYTNKDGHADKNKIGLTEDFWPLYGVAGGVGTLLGWSWLLFLGSRASQVMKVSVHILTTYLAVISVLCFWGERFFWGVAFAVGALLQFLYVISVIERLPFTMLVLQKAVKMVWSLPDVMKVGYAFMLVMLSWMVIWSFGAAGVVASSMNDGKCWWLLVVLSISLFWTGAVLCNTVHVIVSGMVFLVLIHGGREAASMPPNSLVKSMRYAVTKSFGSICYGSLFTAAIRTLRWEIRGFRSKIGNNECLLCCVDFLFHLVETLVRFFNKYAYVQIAVNGKGFNHSARDAWELFQSTGVEALVAYDCSGAVLLMSTLLGGLITGTCSGVWAWNRNNDRMVMVASTAMMMGMVLLENYDHLLNGELYSNLNASVPRFGVFVPELKLLLKERFLVGLAMVVVESAVTSMYICYAEDPLLIHRWDTEFFNQMSETLHQRLQHRSARAREVWTHNQVDGHIQGMPSV